MESRATRTRVCLQMNTFTIVFFTLVILTPLTSGDRNIHEGPCPNPYLEKCQCSKNTGIGVSIDREIFKVNCSNSAYNAEGSLHALASIPRSVNSVVFSGNNMPELRANIFGVLSNMTCRNMNQLNTLDLSKNNIGIIHGKTFHCMKNLDILILDNNKWDVKVNDKTRVFSSLSNLHTLSLRNAFSGSQSFTALTQTFRESFLTGENNNVLEEIHLEDNHLKFFNTDLFSGLRNLRRIYFSRNNISRPEILPQSMRNVEELYLDHNNISSLSMSFLQETLPNATKLTQLDLRGNPFHCDCDIIPTKQLLQDHRKSFYVISRDELKCASPASVAGKRLDALTDDDVTCINSKSAKKTKVRTSYIILGVIFGILGVLFLAVLYLNRFTIQRKLKIHIVEPVRESIMGRSAHGYASVDV